MAFCITFGTQEFTSQLKGYEGVTAQCQNCGNWSAHCQTRWPWFTVCFIPVIPLATHKYEEVHCNICRFSQDMKYRPDVKNGQGGAGGPPQQYQQQQYQPPHQQQYQQQYQQQGPPQGWNQQKPPQGQPGGQYQYA